MQPKNEKMSILFFLYIYFSLSIINVLLFGEIIEAKNKSLKDKNNEKKISRHNIENYNNNKGTIINKSTKKLSKLDGLKSRLLSSSSSSSFLSQSVDNNQFGKFGKLISLGKETQQSPKGEYQLYPSYLAVDGNKNADLVKGKSCSLAKSNNSYPWWRVDLGEKFIIRKIKIFNRGDCCSERLKKYNVMISNTPYDDPKLIPETGRCAPERAEHGETQKVINIHCDRPIYGQYVTIFLNVEHGILHLCEVEVYGHKYNDTVHAPKSDTSNKLSVTINM